MSREEHEGDTRGKEEIEPLGVEELDALVGQQGAEGPQDEQTRACPAQRPRRGRPVRRAR